MIHERWVGSHGNWKRSNESIDGYPSRNERSQTDTQDLDDLITWLEYGKTSGNIAMRQSQKQEEYWGKLVRSIICEKLTEELAFFEDGSFEFICSQCGYITCGSSTGDDFILTSDLCKCLASRESDILQYVAYKFEL